MYSDYWKIGGRGGGICRERFMERHFVVCPPVRVRVVFRKTVVDA